MEKSASHTTNSDENRIDNDITPTFMRKETQSHPHPHSIPRKPIAVKSSTTLPPPPPSTAKTTPISISTTNTNTTPIFSTGPSATTFPPPPSYTAGHHATHPYSSSSSPASRLVHRIKARWATTTRGNRILFISGIVVLVVLVTGLSAGLASRNRTQNLPLPSSHGGPYTGDLTYYEPALGACGVTSTSADNIVSVSHLVFDAVSTSSDPNANPLCGKKIRARRDDKSVDLTVVDRCEGCKAMDIDVTRSAFAKLAEIKDGRVFVQWSWLEDVPVGATG